MEELTFRTLAAEIEKRMPGGSYSLSVELAQSKNSHPTCQHEPKIKRSLEWRIWDGKKFYEGDTPEKALAAYDVDHAPKAESVSDLDLAGVDAHKTNEIPF